jgi:hypothetical protein
VKRFPLRLDAHYKNISHVLTSCRYDTGFFIYMEALTVMTAGAFEIVKCKKESRRTWAS